MPDIARVVLTHNPVKYIALGHHFNIDVRSLLTAVFVYCFLLSKLLQLRQARRTFKLRRTLGHGREGIAIVRRGRQDSRCVPIEILYPGVSLEQMTHIEK